MRFLASNHYILSSCLISHRKKGEFEVLEVTGRRGRAQGGENRAKGRGEESKGGRGGGGQSQMGATRSRSDSGFLRLSSDEANL